MASAIEQFFVTSQQGTIAPGIRDAARRSLRQTTQCELDQLLWVLGEVDRDLESLRGIAGGPSDAPTQYANWARYWVDEDRDAALARQLVLDVMIPHLAALQAHLAGFTHSELPNWTKRCRFALRHAGRVWSERQPQYVEAGGGEGEDHPSSASRSLQMLARVGRTFDGGLFLGVSRQGMYHGELALSVVADCYEKAGSEVVNVVDRVSEELGTHAGGDPVLPGIASDAGTSVPGSVFGGVMHEYRALIVDRCRERFRRRLDAATARQTLSMPASRRVALRPLPGRAPLALISLSPLIALKGPSICPAGSRRAP